MTDHERLEKAKIVGKLVNEFKAFCMDSIMEGHADNTDGPFEFIKIALEPFQEIMEAEKEKFEQAQKDKLEGRT